MNKIITLGILAIIAIVAITLIGTRAVFDSATGFAMYGIYNEEAKSRVLERQGDVLSYEQRINRAASAAAEQQRLLSSLPRGRYGGVVYGGDAEKERGLISNIEPYGYSPYRDREMRNKGYVYVDSE